MPTLCNRLKSAARTELRDLYIGLKRNLATVLIPPRRMYSMYSVRGPRWPQAAAPRRDGGSRKLASHFVALNSALLVHAGGWSAECGKLSIAIPTVEPGTADWVTAKDWPGIVCCARICT